VTVQTLFCSLHDISSSSTSFSSPVLYASTSETYTPTHCDEENGLENPLPMLPLIPQHPASLTSRLSSALTDPKLFNESSLEVSSVLDNFGKLASQVTMSASLCDGLGKHKRV
jgi:hypothetical protein